MQFDIRRFDIYRKIPKDLTQPTHTGAIISILSGVVMVFLFLSEFYSFITPEIISELFVDAAGSSRGRMGASLNITLPRLRCDFIGLDIQDEMGRHEVGFQENTQKWEINGGEGCKFEGHFNVNKVPGNFHVSTHGAVQQPEMIDMAHTIDGLRFGDDIHAEKIDAAFVSLKNVNKEETKRLSSHDYILRVVPTIYEKLDGTQLYSFQYSWAYKDYISYGHGGRVMPAIWFRYDLSPITVKYIERRKPFYHFITTVFAIVGGTFTVAGIIDSLLFTASEVYKKFQIGKLT
ncbi:endoplasmic reticulum-Golgi intermediate compartment protein 1-like [Xenia sp. Carnegie-2017]|uniref:endoplasmic reticulum-Golgi intermediate compartment protein 1-like n=1 Tax=Xenia sp. Carnegie-2017 TaxID=2897299 RepID=UPI001F048AEE|nr:endoplasmic reticulum-Golgi intermediate compartment protein 1-like [Xenia sp. Carnegie-2017]